MIGPTTRLQQASAEGFGTGVFTTSAFTPSNDSLLVVCCRAQSTTDDAFQGDQITIAPSTGTATLRLTTPDAPAGWAYGMRIWTIPITTGASMTLDFDAGGFIIHQYKVDVYEYTGYDTGAPIGATASGSDADGDGAVTGTLTAAPASSSSVLAFVQVALSTTGVTAVDVGSGFTELWDNLTNGWSVDQTQHRTGSTSTSVPWADINSAGVTGAGALYLAIEIKDTGGGGGGTSEVNLLLLGVG